MNSKVFSKIALCQKLTRNEICFFLCAGKPKRTQDIIKITGWHKSNVSRMTKKLRSMELIDEINKDGFAYFSLNDKWEEMKVTD